MGSPEVRQDYRFIESSEGRKLMVVYPPWLLSQNPPIHIKNNRSYDAMEAGFDPKLYEPSKVAWVRTGTGARELRIVDGFTRTLFHNDHIGRPHPNAPGYDFKEMVIWDQTDLLLRNPYISSGQSDQERAELTELEYYRAIVEHVKGHADISAARIAAHTIMVWKSLVGNGISSRFPVTAALSLLEEVRAHFYDRSTLLNELVRSYSQSLDGSMNDRDVIFTALVDISQVVKDANLDMAEVSGEVFRMLAVGEDYIGGTNETTGEIQKILNSPVIVAKLKSVYGDSVSLERFKVETAREIVGLLREKAGGSAGTRLKAMRRVLLDRRLDWDTTITVISSDGIDDRYGEEIAGYHRARLRQIYKERTGSEDLEEIEQVIINNLGSVIHISDGELERMVTGIGTAVPVVKDALILREHLSKMSEGSLDPQLLFSAQDLDEALQSLLTDNKVNGLTRSRKRLEGVIAKIRSNLEIDVEDNGEELGRDAEVDQKDVMGPNRVMELSMGAFLRSFRRQMEIVKKQGGDVSPEVYEGAKELVKYFKKVGLVK